MSSFARPVGLGLLLFTVYFAVAGYFVYSYAPPQPPTGTVAQLKPPFQHFYGRKLAFVVKAPSLEAYADSAVDPHRSGFLVYEDDKILGPPHSEHAVISELGGGRFSHWTGEGFIFSSSDNTSPQTTGRRYWIVKGE